MATSSETPGPAASSAWPAVVDGSGSEPGWPAVPVRTLLGPQLYDVAVRRWVEAFLPEFLAWLDPSLAGLPATAFGSRAGTFTRPHVHVDLLAAVGDAQLVHVEYETVPQANLVGRMFIYRGQIMLKYPGIPLTQHILDLGRGNVSKWDDQNGEFLARLNIVYLRRRDPAEFLADPVFAPFAVLARGSPEDRSRSLAASFLVISQSGHALTGELLTTAEALATIWLDASTIARIRRESRMSVDPMLEYFRNTPMGRAVREEGRGEERRATRRRILLALLRSRFGGRPELEAIVDHLVVRPEAEAIEAVSRAVDPLTLLNE